MRDKEKCCGTCKWHKKDKHSQGGEDWMCVNPDCYYCTDYTDYDDWCEDWEVRT